MSQARIKKAIAFIEDHLHEPFAADAPARAAGMSAYHFNRQFTALTGISPGKYIRRRRLGRAARALRERRATVMDIALEAGFDSHEAFTRAFRHMFGVSPRTFRDSDTPYAHLLQPEMDAAMLAYLADDRVSLSPVIRHWPGERVAGPGGDYDIGTDPMVINRLWQAMFDRQHELRQAPEPAYAVGVSRMQRAPNGMQDGRLNYTAALPVADDTPVPDDMQVIVLPAGQYAVFTHHGDLADFGNTVRHIWGTALPKSGYTPAGDFDFELYDDRFDPVTLQGAIEIWIPLQLDNTATEA
jgi:AraC family transcriptional regulator